MLNKISKIVLGTVQFGLNYGINNTSGKVCFADLKSILSYAYKSGIKTLDTSHAYGDSEIVLGKSFLTNDFDFNVISKYPLTDKSVKYVFEESLSHLGKDKIYGYLVHHFDYYRLNPEIWADFVMLKNQGKVSKIGFSIYSIEQLQYLFDNNVAFDLIQFPYNIFDRQFEPYLSKLKNMGVEIHTRSVFLQGLFFKDLSTLDGKLSALKPYLSKLHQYCETMGISVTQLALNYVLNNQFIDGVLIGVDSVEQLKCNIDVLDYQLDNSTTEFVDHINIKEKELLNPVNWK